MTIDRVRNINLYIGNSNDSNDIDHLRRLGITSVVNVAKELVGPWFHGNFRNYKVSLLDGPGNQEYQYFLAGRVVLELLANQEKVLVHCISGMSRSPGIATLVLAYLNGSTMKEAYKLVRESRSISHVNPAHWPLLEQAYNRLKK